MAFLDSLRVKKSETEIINSIRTSHDPNLVLELKNNYFHSKDSLDNIDKLSTLYGINSIPYSKTYQDFISILKNQPTHDIHIGQVVPNTTSGFISLSYETSTLNNYKKYLQNQEKLINWDSISNYLINNYQFNIEELTHFNKEIGVSVSS